MTPETSMIWRNWIDLAGDVRGTPAIAGWTSRFIRVSLRGQNGNVMLGWRDEAGWGGTWEDTGLASSDAPAVTSVDGLLCVFARGSNNHLWIVGSMPAQDLGGDVQSAPAVAQWRLDHTAHVFARGSDNAVWHLVWSPSSVSSWQSLGGTITGSPAAVAWGPNRIDVFGRGNNLQLQHCFWDGVKWSAWESLVGMMDSFPSAVSRDIGTLEVFYGDDTGHLATRRLDSAGWAAVQKLGPAVESTPCAFTFGPQHVEVFHTTRTGGALKRIFAQGARPGDDPASTSITNGPFGSAPSVFASATTTIHCVARGGNGTLHHITYDDGYWGPWEDLGGPQTTSDPVAASPFANGLDIAVQSAGGNIFRRRLNYGSWGPWVDTAGQTKAPMAVLVQANETRFLVRGTDNHLYEGAVALDGTWRPWRDLGGTMQSRPHVAEVVSDMIPKPLNAFGPNFAVAGGRYLCSLGTDGKTWARRLGGGDWEPWVHFPDGNAQIERPVLVTWPLGFASVHPGFPVQQGAQAGWIGRTAGGNVQASASWWQEVVLSGYVSYTALQTMPWTTLAPTVYADPVGLIMWEPLDPNDRTAPAISPTTWLFSKLSGGSLVSVALNELAPAPAAGLTWNFFDSPIAGDPALLVVWERFDDAPLFHVVDIDTSGRLRSRSGGTFAAPTRIQPQPSLPPSLPILNPTHPILHAITGARQIIPHR
jgi:hypothetical protein